MKKVLGWFKGIYKSIANLVQKLISLFNKYKEKWSGYLDRKGKKHRFLAVSRFGWNDYNRHNMSLHTNGFAYTTFLSLFPLLLLVSSVLGYVLKNNQALQKEVTDAVLKVIPGLGGTVNGLIDSTIANRNVVGVLGLIGLIWGGTAIMGSIGQAFGVVWGTGQRPFLNRKAVELAVMISIGIMGALTIGLNLISSHYLASTFKSLGGAGHVFIFALGLLASLVINFLIFITIYRAMPRKKAGWKSLAGYSAFFAITFLITEYIFNWYFVAMTRTQAVYGTIGTVIGILVWLRLVGMVIFLGAEILQRSMTMPAEDWPPGPPHPKEASAPKADSRSSKASTRRTTARPDEED